MCVQDALKLLFSLEESVWWHYVSNRMWRTLRTTKTTCSCHRRQKKGILFIKKNEVKLHHYLYYLCRSKLRNNGYFVKLKSCRLLLCFFLLKSECEYYTNFSSGLPWTMFNSCQIHLRPTIKLCILHIEPFSHLSLQLFLSHES